MNVYRDEDWIWTEQDLAQARAVINAAIDADGHDQQLTQLLQIEPHLPALQRILASAAKLRQPFAPPALKQLSTPVPPTAAASAPTSRPSARAVQLPIRVCIESPCRGHVPESTPAWLRGLVERFGRTLNMEYAKRCVLDSLRRGEAPFASHVLYDRAGILDDAKPEERELGMRAGRAWEQTVDLMAVYADFGLSEGMKAAIYRAGTLGIQVETRSLVVKR